MAQNTQEQIEFYKKKLSDLSNNAECEKAFKLAKRLMKKYPDELHFAYYEAVMTAEDDLNYTPRQVEKRFKSAAEKMKLLIKRSGKVPPAFKHSLLNEFFWFSKQPYKQYKLGVKARTLNKYPAAKRKGYYSEGVGSTQLAKNYALSGKKRLSLKWAKISEKAWEKYFKIEPNWANAYIFYGMSLGYQDRLKESDLALDKYRKLSGKPKNWSDIKKIKDEIKTYHKLLYR